MLSLWNWLFILFAAPVGLAFIGFGVCVLTGMEPPGWLRPIAAHRNQGKNPKIKAGLGCFWGLAQIGLVSGGLGLLMYSPTLLYAYVFGWSLEASSIPGIVTGFVLIMIAGVLFGQRPETEG